MNSSDSYEESFAVDPAHPSLAGHFVGNPILPGVVVLDRVLDAADRWLGPGVEVVGLPRAKFASPLRPGDTAQIRLRYRAPNLEFEVLLEQALIASGAFEVRDPEDCCQ